MRVLLTGATGFIGRAILPELVAGGHEIRIAARSGAPDGMVAIDWRHVGDLAVLAPGDLAQLMSGIDAVIHAAGHAHAMGPDDGGLHARINRDATIRLAEAAAQAGARFVFLSSIKALGPPVEGVLTEGSARPAPDAYGHAKADAEASISHLLPQRNVILQPSLVVGPEARGNLARLLSLAKLPLPLPFGAVHAPRAMISRVDVAALAVRALSDERMTGRRFVLADPSPISLAEMIACLREGLGRKPELLPMPPPLLEAALRMVGRSEEAERLLTPLIAAPSGLLALGWQPVMPVRQALRMLAAQPATG